MNNQRLPSKLLTNRWESNKCRGMLILENLGCTGELINERFPCRSSGQGLGCETNQRGNH